MSKPNLKILKKRAAVALAEYQKAEKSAEIARKTEQRKLEVYSRLKCQADDMEFGKCVDWSHL